MRRERVRAWRGAWAATLTVACSLGLQLSVYSAESASHDPALCGPPAPEEVFPVSFTKLTGGAAYMTWYSQWGYYTDIVRGSVTALSSSHGNYTVATLGCLMDDLDHSGWTSFTDPGVPNAGEGYWYLLRFDQYSGCPNGEGTYNSRQGHQVGDRNLEIQTSGNDCGCYMTDGGFCTVYNP